MKSYTLEVLDNDTGSRVEIIQCFASDLEEIRIGIKNGWKR